MRSPKYQRGFLSFATAAASAMGGGGAGGTSPLGDIIGAGGPIASESGDIVGGSVDFGPIELGGISRGLSVPSLPKDPIQLAIVGALILVAFVFFARRK